MYPLTPKIIRETCNGLQTLHIQDYMLQNRELECTNTIDSESVYSLCQQLRYLQKQDPNAEITMYIDSPGGEVNSGLALYDVMQGISCPIRTVCVGMAASMGAILFAAGTKRQILPHGRVMIHDPRINRVGGSALQLHNISQDLMTTRDEICRILAKHTGKSEKEIYEKTSTDTWFNAEEAVEFGLADCVVQKI